MPPSILNWNGATQPESDSATSSHDVVLNPHRKTRFIEFARGNGEYRANGVQLARCQPQASDGQEKSNRQKSDAFATVNKRMVFDEAQTVRSSQVRQRALRPIREGILRLDQRRVQKTLIAKPPCPTKRRQALLVQQQKGVLTDLPRFSAHSASALRVSRYSFINSRPASSSSAIAGSYGVIK